MPEQTNEELLAKVGLLEKQLKAAEDKRNEDLINEEKKEAKKAALISAMEHMSYDDKKALRSRVAMSDDEDMKKAMSEIPEEDKDKSKEGKKGQNEDEEKEKLEAKVKTLSASLKEYESDRSVELINDLVTLKASLIPDLDEDLYKTKLKAKTFAELKAMHKDRSDELEALKAAEKEPARKHFGFTAATKPDQTMSKMSELLNSGGMA